MKKKATARPANATRHQSTLNFPTSSEADLVADSHAAETRTQSFDSLPPWEGCRIQFGNLWSAVTRHRFLLQQIWLWVRRSFVHLT